MTIDDRQTPGQQIKFQFPVKEPRQLKQHTDSERKACYLQTHQQLLRQSYEQTINLKQHYNTCFLEGRKTRKPQNVKC